MNIVLLHLYYHHLWPEIKGYFDRIKIDALYVSLVSRGIESEILSAYPNAKILINPNQGKDCGGNLRLIDEWLKDGGKGDFIFQCHGKLGPKRTSHFSTIFNPNVISAFDNPKVGMVGCKESFAIESWNGSVNEHKKYCRRFGFNETKPMTYIQGTIFVVRAKVYRDFFSKVSAVRCAGELEHGDVHEPSNTHAWERLFATLVEESGLTVTGVRRCKGFLLFL